MTFHSWLQGLRPTPAPIQGQHYLRQRSSLRAATHRLNLEALEDRLTPSTFTVTNLLDSGPDSLRAAVASANANPGPDAIDFATTGTITLTSGQLSITDSLSIGGPGADALTISGGNVSRVFRLAGSPTVSIANLTIANGRAINEGGGIYMSGGTLVLNQCTVSGNHAEDYGGGALGGGIFVAGGTLTLDQSTVAYNSAFGSPGYYADFGYDGGRAEGGGLYVAYGMVSVNQSNFYGNLAAGGDGSVDYWTGGRNGNGGGAAGGGLRIAGGTLGIRQSTFSGNVAVGGLPGSEDSYPFNSGLPGVGEGGGLFISRYDFNPAAYLDTFTVDHTINNSPDNIVGPYFLDAVPRLTIGDVSVLEGNTGTRGATFTVTLSAAYSQPVSVAYSTGNGSATTGSDYQAASGILTIPAGQTTGTITILVSGDRVAEANETFVVNLSAPTNATIADGQGQGTIVDDEPRISIGDVTKAEGKKGQTTLFTFTVTLSAAYDQAVTMSFRTVNGTATTSDNDYIAKTGTLTFAPGETTKTITIAVNGDSKREANETFYLDLYGLSINGLFTKNRGIGTILNDD